MLGYRTLFLLIFSLTAMSIPLEASKRIVVDLSRQIALAYEGSTVLFYGRISSGKPGRRTPTGHFRVLEKDIDHVSNLWPAPNGGARMHYMLRLTRDGVAMHLGPTPDYPASHGCVRMQNGFAQRMFFWAEKGTPVDVVGIPPERSPKLALPDYADPHSMALYEQATQRVLKDEEAHPHAHNNALTAISSNPKLHHHRRVKLPGELVKMIYGTQTHRPMGRPLNTSRRSPLDAISAKPKRHRPSPAALPIERTRVHRPDRVNHHPDPLRAVRSD